MGLAYLEPVVDCIDPRQMISQPAVIKSIDINTCTVDDLDFTADFELVSEHTEFCHALVGWFDTSFSHAHKPLVLQTGPTETPTHWKQTVFYLREGPLPMQAGESVRGKLK